jgi:hypothetical protein
MEMEIEKEKGTDADKPRLFVAESLHELVCG